MKTLWMMVSSDELELPLIVVDSAKELSEITGLSENNIRSTVSHYEHGRHKSSRFHRVRIEEGDDE